eukprot:symbB.v1.2.010917.t1/scaffold697.1/size171729/8
MSSSKMQMEGEVSAWQAICKDAEEATQRYENRLVANEAQKVQLQEEARQVKAKLQETESEVARIHALTSSLEAQRLQAVDRAREKIKDMMEQQVQDSPAPKEMELRSELALAQQRAETLRLECSEERQRCRQLVARVSARLTPPGAKCLAKRRIFWALAAVSCCKG